MINKIKDFFKVAKNKKNALIILAIIGICIIGISYLPNQSNEHSEAQRTINEQNLEERTKEIIETITGKDTTEVMITFKNTYVPTEEYSETSTSFSISKSNPYVYKSIPAPEIAGVMIVCTALDNNQDFATVKQAVSTCLDIPQSKIYIIGGKTYNEKNIKQP